MWAVPQAVKLWLLTAIASSSAGCAASQRAQETRLYDLNIIINAIKISLVDKHTPYVLNQMK